MRISPARHRALVATAAAAVLAASSAGCSPHSSSAGAGAGDITIGASLPLSGALAGFGSFEKWGYQHAVDEVNSAGGIAVGGTKHRVTLKILDDMTDPNTASSNVQTLISSDHVAAVLGSCTPDLVNPGAVVADRQGVPFVTGCDPAEAFAGVKHWTWAWDIFFTVSDLTAAPFETMRDLDVATNKKVAILHDNGPDGMLAGNQVWPATAAHFGYTIVANASFPVDNTDFSAAVQTAKASGADILLVDAVTPQAISLRKQMAAVGWTPKLMVNEKGAEPVQYAQALGSLANGVIVGAYWDPSFPYPGDKELQTAFETQTGHSSSQHVADTYTAAKVLLDAIGAAGSTDPDKINYAIGQTDAMYPTGLVKFSGDNTSTIPVVESQWQNGKSVIVWPKIRTTGSLLFPMPTN